MTLKNIYYHFFIYLRNKCSSNRRMFKPLILQRQKSACLILPKHLLKGLFIFDCFSQCPTSLLFVLMYLSYVYTQRFVTPTPTALYVILAIFGNLSSTTNRWVSIMHPMYLRDFESQKRKQTGQRTTCHCSNDQGNVYYYYLK